MIANARMYAVSPDVTRLWQALFGHIVATTGLSLVWVEHAAPAPLEELWRNPGMGAVFMCGLPFARARPQPLLVAAPVPSPAAFGGKARYWSEFVVRHDSAFSSVAETFGRRIAFTVPDSQSGCIAALSYFESLASGGQGPLFAELIAPTITPLGALQSVIKGDADIAPVDSYAFNLLCAHRPDLTSKVRVVGRTRPTPIPPLVASHSAAADGANVDSLSSAFVAAHTDPASRLLMDRLLLQRFVRPDAESYVILEARFQAATQFWRSRPFAAVTHSAFAW